MPAKQWFESAIWIDFIWAFRDGRVIKDVSIWTTFEGLGTSPQRAIQDLLQNGVLYIPSLEDTLYAAYTVADLQSKLRERELRFKGSKKELINGLILADRSCAEQMAAERRVAKCTPETLKTLLELKEEQVRQADKYKTECCAALQKRDVASAITLRTEFGRRFVGSFNEEHITQGDIPARALKILECSPQFLGNLTAIQLEQLKLAAAMAEFWGMQDISKWINDPSITTIIDLATAVNRLMRYGRLQVELDRFKEYDSEMKYVFSTRDLTSCELCRKLNEQVFPAREAPVLPLQGCTSPTGCECTIQVVSKMIPIWGDPETKALIKQIKADANSPLSRMATLRELYKEQMISQEDYLAEVEDIVDYILLCLKTAKP